MIENKNPKIKSLYKAMKILDYFSKNTPELGVTELAQKTGMQKSAVHNIMQTFELCGMIQKNAETKKYRLGKKTLELANKFQINNSFYQVLKVQMKALSAETGENVYFAVPYEKHIIYIDAFSTRDPFLSQSILGTVVPSYCTGLGKAILAEYDDSFIDEIIFDKKFTPTTITDKQTLLDELRIIRSNGYAIDNMEHEFGIKCVAIALKENNEVIGGISLSGPSLRFSNDIIIEYAQKLKDIAKEILRN